MGSRISWQALRASEAYQGKWIALDACRYDKATGKPIEGELVDADEDLAALCARLREADRTRCAIVLCEPCPVSAVPPSRVAHSARVSH